MTRTRISRIPANKTVAIVLCFSSCEVLAQSPDQAQSADADILAEVQVWGRATDLVGVATSASEGLVGFSDLSTRPLLRVGELVEVIPGMIATQHSGGGKANQYFLRGMNLDHGTDFSVHFDGIPVNMRSHAHGQGYLDLNFIIPELVETIDYRKGTYFADVGDFSAASTSRFATKDSLPEGFATATWGSQEYMRFVGANSWQTEAGTWLAGAELRFSDGAWDNPEDVELFNGLGKLTTELWGRRAEFMATHYTNDWNATDQIPRRAFRSGDLGRYGFVDPTVGGSTSRSNLVANLTDENVSVSLFISRYDLNLFGNPTYFLNDPVNGDQIEQADERWIVGGRLDGRRALDIPLQNAVLKYGVDIRHDAISQVGLFLTRARERLTAVRDDSIDESSVGAYLSLEVNLTDRLRASAGARLDYFWWDVDAILDANSGSGSDSVVTPKLGLAYSISDSVELYANYGEGFHSNDVRAGETRIDPSSGDPVEPVPVIADATGIEAGFRAQLSERLNFSVSLFSLELDSELIFVGDAGTTEPNDATERTGYEAAVFWQPFDWLVVDGSFAKTDARFQDLPGNADRIPDAHDTIGALGLTASFDSGLIGSLRVRHFGDAPLSEDGSAEKDGATLVNLGVNYPVGRFDVGVDVLNLFDSTGNDIEYFYESRLPNEAAPVEDFHFHPVEPREFRVQVSYRF